MQQPVNLLALNAPNLIMACGNGKQGSCWIAFPQFRHVVNPFTIQDRPPDSLCGGKLSCLCQRRPDWFEKNSVRSWSPVVLYELQDLLTLLNRIFFDLYNMEINTQMLGSFLSREFLGELEIIAFDDHEGNGEPVHGRNSRPGARCQQ